MSVVDLLSRLRDVGVADLGAGGLALALADSARVRAWLDAFDVACAQRLQELTPLAEQQVAGVTRAGRRATNALFRRSATIEAVPMLGESLSQGAISSGHVDVFGHALNTLDASHQQVLVDRSTRLLEVAGHTTPAQFARALKLEIAELDQSAGVDRFERQRRETSLRMWVDDHTGMYRLHGQLDPESGLLLEGRLDSAIEKLFHAKVPDTCPTGDGKQGHLRALALLSLTSGVPAEGTDIVSVGDNIDLCIVVDLDTIVNGLHERSLLDPGSEADLPVAVIRRLACTAGLIPVVLNSDGVVLDEGRKKRLASRNQRRALRVMYETCAMLDCRVRSKHCEPHHLDEWGVDEGLTNLDRLLPLCSRHHHAVHEGGWRIEMHADRSLTITLPDGSVLKADTPAKARRHAA